MIANNGCLRSWCSTIISEIYWSRENKEPNLKSLDIDTDVFIVNQLFLDVDISGKENYKIISFFSMAPSLFILLSVCLNPEIVNYEGIFRL